MGITKTRCIALAATALFVSLSLAQADIVPSTTFNGRFVKVAHYGGTYREFHLAELEIFAPGVGPNQAGTGSTSTNDHAALFYAEGASSGFGGGHGANTAPLNNYRETGGDTYDRLGTDVYYIVDMGSAKPVSTIRTWQRDGGCCQERLSNFTVSLLADNAGTPGTTVASKSWAGNAPTSSFASIEFGAGRNVRPGGAGAIGTETIQGTDGANVRVFTAGTQSVGGGNVVENLLHIGEIRALDASGTNFALGSQGGYGVTVSGVYAHGADVNLNNGTLDTGGNAWTRGGAAEAKLLLGTTRFIKTIEVGQRADGCCQDRLRNFTVQLTASDNSARYTQAYPGQAPTNSYAVFTLPDAMTLEAADTLMIDVNPATASADRLAIGLAGNGSLTILPGASLTLSMLSLPTDQPQTFNILDFGSISGSFTNINLPTYADMSWNLTNLYTTGEVTLSVPEPATMGLLLMAATGLGRYARRRTRAA